MKAAVFILAGAILVAHPGVTRAQSVGVSVGNVGAGMPMAGAPSFNTSIFSGGRQAGAPQAIDPVREVHPLGSVLATSQSGVATLPGSAALTGTPVGLALPVGQQTQAARNGERAALRQLTNQLHLSGAATSSLCRGGLGIRQRLDPPARQFATALRQVTSSSLQDRIPWPNENSAGLMTRRRLPPGSLRHCRR